MLLPRSRHSGNVTMCAADFLHEPSPIIDARDDRHLVLYFNLLQLTAKILIIIAIFFCIS